MTTVIKSTIAIPQRDGLVPLLKPYTERLETLGPDRPVPREARNPIVLHPIKGPRFRNIEFQITIIVPSPLQLSGWIFWIFHDCTRLLLK